MSRASLTRRVRVGSEKSSLKTPSQFEAVRQEDNETKKTEPRLARNYTRGDMHAPTEIKEDRHVRILLEIGAQAVRERA